MSSSIMMFVQILLNLFLLCLSLPSYCDSETLLSVYALAEINDHQSRVDHAQFLADSEIVNINRAVLRPQITAIVSVNKRKSDEIGGSTNSKTVTNKSSYGLFLKQEIINYTAKYTYQQAKITTRIAKVNYQAKKQDLIIRSAKAYFNALRALDRQRTARAKKRAQELLLEQTRQRFDLGIIPINDRHEAQSAYDTAVANMINTDSEVGIRLDLLSLLTGYQHTEIVPLRENFSIVVLDPNKQEYWVDLALANNLKLKANELAVDVARLAAKAARSSYFPKVHASVTHNYHTYHNNVEDRIFSGLTSTSRVESELFGDQHQTSFSLNFNVPIYSGGGTAARIRQAAQNLMIVHEKCLLSKRSTMQKTRSLYLSISTNIAQIKARKQATISNRSALESSKAGYEAGIRDIVDVVNAQSNLFKTQQRHLDNIYEYIINTLLLKQVAGVLQVSDLEILEQSLTVR